MKKQGELLHSSKRKSPGERVLSILLTLCMVLTLLPTAALATEPTEPTASTVEPVAEEPVALLAEPVMTVTINGSATNYTDPAEGWNKAAEASEAVTVKLLADWKAAPTSNAYKTSFGTGAGFGNGKGGDAGYILVPDGKTITLDLNGHTLDRGLKETAVSEGEVIEVKGTLTLQDNGIVPAKQGTITGANSRDGYGAVYVYGGTFTMEGGSITGNKASNTGSDGTAAAGGVYTSGTFTMTGGSITDNTGSGVKSVGGVFVASNGGTFTMTGGSITGNKSGSGAGGVFLETDKNGSNNTLTVGGTAQITGNQLTGGTTSNVLLQNNRTITCATTPVTPLAPGATIGVTTETTPTAGKPVTITGASSADYSQYFFSDNAAYHTINTGKDSSQVVQLATEQFTLPLGGTYYFDLSSEKGTITNGVSSTMGTINVGKTGDKPYPGVPDPTLHYVPFTYAGTVNAYSLESASSGQIGSSAAATASDRSLFVADYTVSHTKKWHDLNTADLIFGKEFDTNYKLRSLSAGSSKIEAPLGGSPATNEWDRILKKSNSTDNTAGWIKNWSGISSWGQDTGSTNTEYRMTRGFTSAAAGGYVSYATPIPTIGWRPALEVLNPATLTSDGLNAVTLNLGGGKLKDSTANISIVCAGETFTAPSGEGLTPPLGTKFDKWQKTGEPATTYAAGTSITHASGLELTAQWKSLPQELAPTAAFAATGADSGTLSGLTAGTSYKYSVDGGSTYTDFTGATATITSGITATNGVWVVKAGNNTSTSDSDPLVVTVTQATAPTVGKTDCTTSTSNDGTMTGVTTAMEYRKGSDTTYTTITGTTVTGLAPATYHVRVKAAGTVLASADVGVTIGYNSGGGSSGGYTPTLTTELKAGDSLTGDHLDRLIAGGKDLTVTGAGGAKLVFDTDALRGINAQTSGSVKVEIKDVSKAHQDTHEGKTVFSLTVTSGGKTVSDFGGKVSISLPYTLKDGEKAEDVTVWHLAEDGSMTEIPATYDPKTGLATATVNHFSQYVVGVAPWVNPFTDVQPGDWCYDAVKFAHQNGLFSGTTATSFAPNATMTRAMLWMVLARQDGRDTTGGSPWYEKGLSWARETGISDGTKPMGKLTREQLITMLWRYAGSPVLMDDPGLSSFTDAGDIAAYAQQAMAWAHQKGLVQGSNNALNPKQNATRAQVAAILMRYCQNVAK